MHHVFATLSDWLPGRAMTLSLWCGLIVLTIWLLLLARTRWGQARPISKCVALSLFAHLLLGIYAYGTRIFVDYPAFSGESTSHVQLIVSNENDDAETADPRQRDAEATEFIDPADEPLVETPEAELPRNDAPLTEQAVDETDIQAATDAVTNLPLPQLDEHTHSEPTDVPLPEPAVEQTVNTQPVPIDAELIEPEAAENDAEPADMPTPPAPPDVELARQSLDAQPGDTADSTAFAGENPPNVGESQLQTLAEDLVAEEAADAHSSAEDQTQSSDDSASANVESDDDELFSGSTAPPIAVHGVSSAAQPHRPGDGAALPRVYHGRSDAVRKIQVQAMGGDEQTEEAVARALQWLAANQSEDGRWQAAMFGAGEERMVLGHNRGGAGAKADTGITGLALLSFFGAGHSHFEGPYRKNVQHGLEFLLRSQRADGYLGGDAELFASMYCHGIAFLALSEGFALTGDVRLKPFVERAQQFTLRAQIPYDGGWRYRPGDAQGDMSQFGWQVMALRSAEVAGLPIPHDARQGMQRFMRSVASGPHQGRASYRANTQPSRTMTAEAITCRFFLQLDRNPDLEQEAADFLMDEVPGGEPANFYYWYYGSLAMFQLQDPHWPQWNEALKKALLPRQRLDGELAGSWDPTTVWGGYGGRVYTTSMAAMCLEVYYRYLPVYQTASHRAAVEVE